MIENVKKINLILQLRKHGVTNYRVLSILEKIPREQFIDKELFYKAYQNNALPIDCNQTISQPSVVAKMTELLEPKKSFKVLEIGTGSGYQTAILSKLFKRIYSIERHKTLIEKAKNLTKKKIVKDGSIDNALLEKEQFLCHGFSWLTSYNFALREILNWAKNLEKNKKRQRLC